MARRKAKEQRVDTLHQVITELHQVEQLDKVKAKRALLAKAYDHFGVWLESFMEAYKTHPERRDIAEAADYANRFMQSALKGSVETMRTTVYDNDRNADVDDATKEELIDLLVGWAIEQVGEVLHRAEGRPVPQFVKYTLPVYWASYLINGDASGLEDGEQEEIDAWMESEGNPHIVDVGEETWFAAGNDATNLGGDVATYTAQIREAEEGTMAKAAKEGKAKEAGKDSSKPPSPSLVYAKIAELRTSSGLTSVPAVVEVLNKDGYSVEQVHLRLKQLAQAGGIELRPESGLNRLTPAQKQLALPGPQGSVLSWIRETREGHGADDCGCDKKVAEDKQASDFEHVDDALRRAHGEGFTHYTDEGEKVTVYKKTTGGWLRQTLYFEKGRYHWPHGGKYVQTVKTLPGRGVAQLEDLFGGRKEKKPSPPQMQLHAGEEHSAEERKSIETVANAFRQQKPYPPRGRGQAAIWTDGEKIYSYSQPILERQPDGNVTINDIDASRTTHAHIKALQRIFGSDIKRQQMGKLGRGDRERWREQLRGIRDRLVNTLPRRMMRREMLSGASYPTAPIRIELEKIHGDIVAIAGVFHDWLTEQGVPHTATKKKDPVPFSEEQLAQAAKELQAAIRELEGGYEFQFDSPADAYTTSRIEFARRALTDVMYEVEPPSEHEELQKRVMQLFTMTPDSERQVRFPTMYADMGPRGTPQSQISHASTGQLQQYIADAMKHERKGASEAPRDNPIDTGDGVPWVKIARDPDQYKEAMKKAEAIGPMDDAACVYKLLGNAMLKEDQEVFLVVLLDVRQQCRGVVEAHRGERSRVGANITDILRAAVNGGAEGIVAVHNHPSGKATPSEADRELTDAIEKGCGVLDIAFVDHVVLGNGEYFSFADNKLHKVKSTAKKKEAAA